MIQQQVISDVQRAVKRRGLCAAQVTEGVVWVSYCVRLPHRDGPHMVASAECPWDTATVHPEAFGARGPVWDANSECFWHADCIAARSLERVGLHVPGHSAGAAA